ncbi:protein of unknown function [Kyrpidia spormannii]|uniref:Uncharacterized protein n=2 Tax=Kyrpidia spormannii TaxID=2055160 RepID=A0ACA8ZDM4_9BACL|nr:protein of unknown function [Kyrpidia spormannii]CAB3396077.1 protein of unknown function [Kyrpidia spormannii]
MLYEKVIVKLDKVYEAIYVCFYYIKD